VIDNFYALGPNIHSTELNEKKANIYFYAINSSLSERCMATEEPMIISHPRNDERFNNGVDNLSPVIFSIIF